MNSTYATYTLFDLQTLRKSWLAEGSKQSGALLLILTTLGQPVVDRRWRPLAYLSVKTPHARAWYYLSEGPYNPARQAYDQYGRLWVEETRNGHQVVNLRFVNGAEVPEQASVFIPGPWVDELLALADAARAESDRRAAEVENAARRGLVELLGIGTLI